MKWQQQDGVNQARRGKRSSHLCPASSGGDLGLVSPALWFSPWYPFSYQHLLLQSIIISVLLWPLLQIFCERKSVGLNRGSDETQNSGQNLRTRQAVGKTPVTGQSGAIRRFQLKPVASVFDRGSQMALFLCIC